MAHRKKMGKQSRRTGRSDKRMAPRTLQANTHPFYKSEFRPITLSGDLLSEDCVKSMLDIVKEGHLQEWNLGRKGTHISSRFVSAGGTEDTLTSPNPNDGDYKSLVLAHMQRAFQIIREEIG